MPLEIRRRYSKWWVDEDDEGTLPEGWIEIGDHEYMNPSTGEWAKVHVKEQSSSTDSPSQERR